MGKIFWKYKKLCNYYVMIGNSCIENIKSYVMIENLCIENIKNCVIIKKSYIEI